MASSNRKFEVTDENDGTVVLEDTDGWSIRIDVNSVTGFDESGENVKARWEDVVSSLLFQHVNSPAYDREDQSVSVDIDECVTQLQDAIEGNVDTSNLEDVFEGEPTERRVRGLIEYFVASETGPLELNDSGEVVLLPHPDEAQLSEEDLMYGDDDEHGVTYLRTWVGFFERCQDALDARQDVVEQKLDHLEKMVTEVHTGTDDEKLDELRQELYNITDGKDLEPAEQDQMGLAIEAPPELESDLERDRWKDIYNEIVKIQARTPSGDPVPEEALKRIKRIRDKLDRSQDSLETQIEQFATMANLVKEGDNIREDILDPEGIQNMQVMFMNATTAFQGLFHAQNQIRQISPSDVYGETEDIEEEEPERPGIDDVEGTLDDTEDRIQENEEIQEREDKFDFGDHEELGRPLE